MKKRRAFTAEFKAQIVLEILTGAKTQAESCREHGLKPDLVARWRTNALARLPDLFRRSDEPATEDARIAELERTVGRLTRQLEAAKKLSRWLTSPSGAGAR